MFGYLLSAAIAFIVFGCTFNIFKKVKSIDTDKLEVWLWFLVLIASLLWFVVVPCLFVVLIVLVLKIATDKISDFILKRVKK